MNIIYPELYTDTFTLVAGDTYSGERAIKFEGILSGVPSGLYSSYFKISTLDIPGTIIEEDILFEIQGSHTVDMREGLYDTKVYLEGNITLFKGEVTLIE